MRRQPIPDYTTEEIQSLAHELADTNEAIVESAFSRVISKPNFVNNPDVACSVLVAKVGNELNDYYFDRVQGDLPEPVNARAEDLRSILAMHMSDIVRRHSSLLLKGMYDLTDEEFKENLLADIRITTFNKVADHYDLEEETPNVEF